jgi:transcriptional regulator with XRE-family HTH domain
MSTSSIDAVVRLRLRSLRTSLGWSLDELADRTDLSPSTISRIENGKRAIDLDVLELLCRALHVDLATLVQHDDDHADVVIRPVAAASGNRTVWPLTRSDSEGGIVAAKWRLEPTDQPPDLRVHPGHDWFFVLEGTIALTLGDRTILVESGEAAEFSTMTPHHFAAIGRPAEVLTVFDRTGHRAHHHDPT